jgi:integrase
MAEKRFNTSYPGVRYREHPTNKHGVGKDRYFSIRYKINGKIKEEGLGWSSEGWTAEKASLERARLRKNQKTGEGPQTLAEKREIERKRKEADQREKTKQERESVTFATFFEKQYMPIAKLTKKPDSCKSEEIYFNNWIKPVIGSRPFKDIMPLQIEKIKQNLLKEKRSPRTIEYIFAIIRQAWNMALRDGLIDRQCPTAEVKKPKISNSRKRFLTRDEAEALLEHMKTRSVQMYYFCIISLYCGLRASEIFNLRWQNINLTDGTILVSDGKGEKSRYAFMTQKVRELFEGMDQGKPDEIIFKSRTGGKVPRISQVFQRAVDDLGFNTGITDPRQKVVFHTLRHTFASWLAMAGTNLYVVQKLMGHASFEMVQRYSHLGENALQAAVKCLETTMEKSGNGKNKVVDIKSA